MHLFQIFLILERLNQTGGGFRTKNYFLGIILIDNLLAMIRIRPKVFLTLSQCHDGRNKSHLSSNSLF